MTCHDVLEHVFDPVSFVNTLFRVLKQGGTCFIDFPNFFTPAGAKHWKKEHIWYFEIDQLERLLKNAGFLVLSVKRPIESKVVFYLRKPLQERPKILFPPGIGDSYWSVVKLQSFLQRESLALPDISIVCPREKEYHGHLRAFPFLEMFPFLHASWNVLEGKSPKARNIWREAYGRPGRTVFKDIFGYDYFIAYNGHLRVGHSLEESDSFECNWDLPMFVSLQQRHFEKIYKERYGAYIVFHWLFEGTYKYWRDEFPVSSVINAVHGIVKQTGCTPVFAGALWDTQSQDLNKVITNTPRCVNLLGKTSVAQLFGLLKGSKAVVGYPSGLTILSAALKNKTLIVWNDYYNKNFVWNCCPPEVARKNYFAENTKNLSVDYLVGKTKEIVDSNTKDSSIDCSCSRETKRNIFMYDFPPITMSSSTVPSSDAVTSDAVPSSDAVTVVCVLRSGGDFTADYVVRLRNMVARNTSVSHSFVCLADLTASTQLLKLGEGLFVKALVKNWNGYWSKIELFRPDLWDTKRLFYFDLDTVILGNIDDLLLLDNGFFALRPWNARNRKKGRCASGMLGWSNTEYSFIYKEFEERCRTIDERGGDQAFISDCLYRHNIKFQRLQDIVSGIYSYKRQCINAEPPADARIVCFHGRPRPHTVRGEWISRHWR